jgi:sugar phosphate isomerase/epimerase
MHKVHHRQIPDAKASRFAGFPRIVSRPAAPEFSLAQLTLMQCAPPELTEIAAATGYEYVSFRPIAFGQPGEPRYPLGTDRTLLARTKAALRATGIQLLDIELARIYPGVDVKGYLPALQAAAELRGRHVLTSVWDTTERTFILDHLSELCELALPLGLTVDLEFVTFAGIRTLAEAAEIVRDCAYPNIGICVDTLHFDRSGCSIDELEELPAKWFHYAQICDGPAEYSSSDAELKRVAREDRRLLGEGGIDVRRILAHLPHMPYSIELPNSRLLADLGPREFARRCLARARTYLCQTASPVVNA